MEVVSKKNNKIPSSAPKNLLVLRCIIKNCKNFIFGVFFSSYPDRREKEDDKGVQMGVVGSVSLLQNMTIASQPISSMDWSPDKVATRVVTVIS